MRYTIAKLEQMTEIERGLAREEIQARLREIEDVLDCAGEYHWPAAAWAAMEEERAGLMEATGMIDRLGYVEYADIFFAC
jgi:hypothetical protein